VSFTVRVALPGEYAEAGRVTAEGYHADELLRRPDGLIDFDYEAQLTDASGRAREAELLVAVDDSECSRSRRSDGGVASDARWSMPAWIVPGRRA
jgi:hypothetical protein